MRAGRAGIKVVGLSLIDVRGSREATGPEVWAVLGRPDWWNVDKFDTRELSGGIEGIVVNVVGFQNGWSDICDCPVIIIEEGRTPVWRGAQGMDEW